MKAARIILPAALLLAVPATAQRASGWEGIWRNAGDTVRIKVARCGPGLCGTVVQASAKAKADAAAGASNQGNFSLKKICHVHVMCLSVFFLIVRSWLESMLSPVF